MRFTVEKGKLYFVGFGDDVGVIWKYQIYTTLEEAKEAVKRYQVGGYGFKYPLIEVFSIDKKGDVKYLWKVEEGWLDE